MVKFLIFPSKIKLKFSKGYHITCQNARLVTIPSNLTKFLRTTEHQNIIVDLSSNNLSILSCDLFQISTIITLILTKNKISYIPSCFSQSSIQILLLNDNHLRFNQTTILSSSKLIYLDLSNNKIPSLPQIFFFHLRRLRTLILNGEHNLFEENNNQWIRSLTTRNQLRIIICDENLHLPLCLFENLFQTNKLSSIELNSNIHCDCSFVYLPSDKIHFRYCQSQQQQGICNLQSSRFEQGGSLLNLQTNKYRQICANEYQICENISMIKTEQLTTIRIDLPVSNKQIELMKSSSITTTIVTITSSKKDNITAGAIIPFVFVLIIVSIVCLYVILSGQFFKRKNREQTTDFIVKRKKRQDMSSGMQHFH
jgi:hypothetical protein